MKKIAIMLMALVLCAFGAMAQKQVIPNHFPKQQPQALKFLKGTQGKPFRKGWVFIDGIYVPPPYTVARAGTSIRINGYPVTGEIVPWNEFIKTQAGVKVTKSVSGEEADSSAEEEVEEDAGMEIDADDAWESSLDDLFDDEPATKKSSSGSSSSYKPRPKKPTVKITYSFDGEFVPNEKTKKYLSKINAERNRIEKQLRDGGLCCFSSRYSSISVDAGVTKRIMEKLPQMMMQGTTYEALAQSIRNAGFVYFNDLFIRDLYRNRRSYQILQQRVNDEKGRGLW